MKSFYLLLIALAISAASCRTKEGEPGPAGESSLNKQGSITGTIKYTDDNGDEATVPFNYQYFESLEDNGFYYEEEGSESYYEVSFRRRDLKDVNNYFNIQGYGYGMNGAEDAPSYLNINFSFLTVINNELYEFDEMNDVEIENISLDPATGRLTCDFSGIVYYDNESSASVTGKVDVLLNRSIKAFNIFNF
jgi:hypothetical protein